MDDDIDKVKRVCPQKRRVDTLNKSFFLKYEHNSAPSEGAAMSVSMMKAKYFNESKSHRQFSA